MLNSDEDAERSILLCCTYCANSYHPKCAGLPPSIRGLRRDWACPECVSVTEEVLLLDPLHVFPDAGIHTLASLQSDEVDHVVSDFDEVDEDAEPLQDYHKLPWLRWKMRQQPDFKGEINILEQLVKDRGHTTWFLPKFHCELNWAELYWGTFKHFVRSQVNGKWGSMTNALWQSYGEGKCPLVLSRRFARKVRELLDLYQFNLVGAFAVYCQSKISTHRLSFLEPLLLAPWAIGSQTTCCKAPGGKKKVRCCIEAIHEFEGTCTVNFGTTKRYDVPLAELSPPRNSLF